MGEKCGIVCSVKYREKGGGSGERGAVKKKIEVKIALIN